MKHGFLLLLIVTALTGALAMPQSSTPPMKKKPVPRKQTTSSKKGKASKKATTAAVTSRQMAPTPERYKEIQQALVDKGYLKSEPNGVWDAQSSDALLRFQTDKQLSPTGKLSSASLIALGLGPKTGDTTVVPPPAPAEAPPAPAPEN